MARDYTNQAIVGVNNQDRTTSEQIQSWVRQNNGDVNPLRPWAEKDVTRHKLVNVAFGEGADSDSFELSESTRMVVTRDSEEEVKPVSNRYNLVDNRKVVETLADVLDNFNLQNDVYGEGRNYKDQVAVDIFFDTHSSVFQNDIDEDLIFGVSVRSATDTSLSVQIEPIVKYTKSGTVSRGIADGKDKFKKMKSEDEESSDMYDKMYTMFGSCIFNLGYLADSFVRDIKQADSFNIDFAKEDFTVVEFFEEWITNPTNAIIEEAVDQVKKRDKSTSNVPLVTAYDLIYSFTHAVNHAANVSDGNRRDRWHKTAQNGLSAPQNMLESVRASFEPDELEETEVEEAGQKAAEIQAQLDQIPSQ